ncbi:MULTISPECIES: N-acetylmuramoyl-L-alanine amidase [Streptomyces]|uniref:N-acetylmuramoyl-L-alanine amidase n=1 Tax=Streptomyces TaxID=1883 RepID=UPI0004BEA5EC|nr:MULTISPECIES: N-acetylmuramoyl-L-alanine amidase [Streptomyces]KOU04018.1 N-acetylmuramoyl-L-alanine amidase [Streptomyces sp. NRRL F-2295]MBD3551497.1 N-acetylmuramoyl-L-alanine amidase [Streptomyces sp. SP18CM02]MDP9953980.1 N-acetyl-anhydromuramyl-L-alanine amidase AmpD [Streptomyces sp. DSM 41269]
MHRRRIVQGVAATVTAALLPSSARTVAAPDSATDYASAFWSPADPANYTVPSHPSERRVDRVIIHVAQQLFTPTAGIFRNPAQKVSAHYVVRSGDGLVAQCVREKDIAWHAGNWDWNTRSIGIEHEGWVDRPEFFTDVMYRRSAVLTADICARHGIPRDREHIVGHHEVPGSDHTDPGVLWDWDRYLLLVAAAG